jgi:hypothetical protein
VGADPAAIRGWLQTLARSLAPRGVLDDDAFRIEFHVTSPERPRIDLGTDHPLAAVTTITPKPTGETEIVGVDGCVIRYTLPPVNPA